MPRQSQRIARADELRVRLAYKFDGKTGKAVTGKKGAADQPRRFECRTPPGHPQEQDKQCQPFKRGLIKLGRMAGAYVDQIAAGLRSTPRKGDAPRQVRGPPPKLGVDKVGNPAQKQAGRHTKGNRVRSAEPVDLVAPRIEPCRHDHAQHAAMKGHAAFPDGQDRGGVLQIFARLVEKDIAETSAQKDTKDDPGQHVFDLGRVHHRRLIGPKPRCLDRHHHQPPPDDNARDIGQRIPAQSQFQPEQRDRENLGRNIGKGDHGLHLRLNASVTARGQPCERPLRAPYRGEP
mmetsp:Transcript_23464/g.41241  ORF Transcript_23464/g.41241 Transcript_23464/m.41241 type:complete len:290 (+) Transcript_23464:2124-2993(+)